MAQIRRALCRRFDGVASFAASPHPIAGANTVKRTAQPGFKGNKASLPSKPCAVCGRPMSWRRAWAKNWEQVRYCSEACRQARAQRGVPPEGGA